MRICFQSFFTKRPSKQVSLLFSCLFSIFTPPLTLSVQHLALGTRKLPHYTTADSAVLDLQAAIGKEETLVLASGQRALIPTGLIFHLSLGFEARIRPRSGLALKHGHHMPQHSKNDWV